MYDLPCNRLRVYPFDHKDRAMVTERGLRVIGQNGIGFEQFPGQKPVVVNRNAVCVQHVLPVAAIDNCSGMRGVESEPDRETRKQVRLSHPRL